MCLRMKHSEVRAQVDIEDQEPPVEELADDAVVCADGASNLVQLDRRILDRRDQLRAASGTGHAKNVLDGRYAYFLLTKAD